MAEIYLSSSDRGRVYALPFLPESFPDLSRSANNEEFETYDSGTYNILGAPGLMEFTLEGVLPMQSYPFAKSRVKASAIISLLEKAMKRKKPVRIVFAGKLRRSLLASVENLSYHENKVGNIAYSAAFKEYRRV